MRIVAGQFFFYFRIFFVTLFVPFLLSCKTDGRLAVRWEAADAPCNRTFVIHDGGPYWLYRWEPHQLILLASKYYTKSWYSWEQSAFLCEANEVITSWRQLASPYDWGVTHDRGDGKVTNVIIDEGPSYFEQYEGHLMLHTVLLKSAADNPEFFKNMFWSSPDGSYQELLDYNVKTRKVEAKYYNPGSMNFMFRAGKNMYIGTGWGMLWRINLSTKKASMVYKPKRSFFYPQFAMTHDERAFIVSRPLPSCIPNVRSNCDSENKMRDSFYKSDIVYEITTGEAVEVLKTNVSDIFGILGVQKNIYLFTEDSQRAIKYNTENKEVVEYKFPFRRLTNINYLDRSFVVCYDPLARDKDRFNLPCVVTDDTFQNTTKPIILPVIPVGISTAYQDTGGRNGPM